jgi:hypothetical protein
MRPLDCWGPDRERHLGQRPWRRVDKAGHMIAVEPPSKFSSKFLNPRGRPHMVPPGDADSARRTGGPQAGPTPRRPIARLLLASPRRSSGSDGVSGMVRSNALWISLPKPPLLSMPQPTMCRRRPTVARRVARLLGDLETYVSGQANIIINYATARRREEPISTAITESTVQWLLHRRMNAQQQMRWSPRGAHLMLKVRTSVVNGTLDRDYAVAEHWARRPFRRAA